MTERVAKRVVARGRVQGVFFRDSVRQRAEQRGVAGWVANRPDGAVEAYFEGDPDDVEALVRFASEGPRSASVKHVEVDDAQPQGLDRFSVR
jgi:acylphosphatase